MAPVATCPLTPAPCCTEHGECDLPDAMVCCDRCPEIELCSCGHGFHLHDGEAVPPLCMVCGDAERCGPLAPAALGHDHDAAGCLDCDCWSAPGNSLPCTCPLSPATGDTP